MYISAFEIQQIKCFQQARLRLPGEGGYAGWNVLLGANGAGKSTLLQAMALSAVGPVTGSELLRLQDRDRWVRRGADAGTFESSILATADDYLSAGRRRTTPYEVRLHLSGNRPVIIEDAESRQPQLIVPSRLRRSLNAGPWSGASGWFSAGYGPFRRLSGGGQEEDQRLAWQGGAAGRHVSLFRESVALTRCESWLKDLYIQANDPGIPAASREQSGTRLEFVRLLIDSLLPSGMRIGVISSQEVGFVNAVGLQVAFAQLSDGYRSFLALAIDLLRQIVEANVLGEVGGSPGSAHVDTTGVVFIDEADAHLHPSWQRELGVRMCRVFPRIQFIVTTHSPFVAQAARPGGLFVLRAHGDRIVIEQPEPSVTGWRADDILTSPLFGLRSTRDEDTEQRIAERVALLGRARTEAEEARLAELTALLRQRLAAPGDTLRELDVDDRISAWLRAQGGAR